MANPQENRLQFDYYYGTEADQFSFYRVPRLLIKDKRFDELFFIFFLSCHIISRFCTGLCLTVCLYP